MSKRKYTPEEFNRRFLIFQVVEWAKHNDYALHVPDNEDEIDFVNVNFKTGDVFFGNMGETNEPV